MVSISKGGPKYQNSHHCCHIIFMVTQWRVSHLTLVCRHDKFLNGRWLTRHWRTHHIVCQHSAYCGRHFADDILKHIFFIENICTWVQISLIFFSQESNQQHLSTGLNNESQKHTKDTPLRPMNTLSTIIVVVVCFITNSFLTSLFFHLHLLYQSYLGLCQATCVQSLQRQPRSTVAKPHARSGYQLLILRPFQL